MGTDDPQLSPADQFRQGLLSLLGMMEPITEMSTGYRAQMEQVGYSPTAAETIALELHVQMIRTAFDRARKVGA